MAYQETTATSYVSRLGGSFKKIFSGLMMVVAGTVLLWWNEGRAVKTGDMLGEAQQACVEAGNIQQLNPKLNGKLVHATGLATTTDSVGDPQFGVGAAGALRVSRHVEYYQWEEETKTETKEKVGGSKEETTTYTYKQGWSRNPVKSENFKDPQYQRSNFILIDVQSAAFQAQNVTLGAYKLPQSMVNAIQADEHLKLDLGDAVLEEYNRTITQLKEHEYADVSRPQPTAADSASGLEKAAGRAVDRASDALGSYTYVHERDNELYIGRNPRRPEVGDVRITFTKTMPREVTVIGKVSGGTLGPFIAGNGKEFQAVRDGSVEARDIFKQEESSNGTWTWILRLAGLLVVIGGLKSMFSMLYVLFKFLPFLASVVEMGVSIVSGALGFGWSLAVIAVAWLFYRPLLSVGLLCVAAAVVAVVWRRGRDKRRKAATVPTAPAA